MKTRTWTNKVPSKPGWYFWRKSPDLKYQWLWDIGFIFSGQELTIESMGHEPCKLADWPTGGMWSLIEVANDD